MQNIPPIGKIIKTDEKRDAVHFAIAPVTAFETLYPGQHIGLLDNGAASASAIEKIGIVDPFLKHGVEAGSKFYLFLYPQTVTSLRHEWTHPAFDGEKNSKEDSELWISNFLRGLDTSVSYDELIETAIESNSNESLFFGEVINGNIPPEFWEHIEVVTGKKISKEHRATYFRCAC